MKSKEPTKKQQQKLRRLLPSSERLAEMFLQSPISMEFYDANGKWMAGNHACMQTFGCNPEAVIGFDLFTDELVPRALRERLRRGMDSSHASRC